MKSEGLSRVPTPELERLFQALVRGRLPLPLSRSALIAGSFGAIEQHLDLLLGLDGCGARRVLVAVIAERRAYQRRAQRE